MLYRKKKIYGYNIYFKKIIIFNYLMQNKCILWNCLFNFLTSMKLTRERSECSNHASLESSIPHSVNILFSLRTAKGNAILGPGVKQQKWSVLRSIDATTTSTSTLNFRFLRLSKRKQFSYFKFLFPTTVVEWIIETNVWSEVCSKKWIRLNNVSILSYEIE